ncbi:MAG TPA: NAD(P)/FAD-dependent oxidoreductase [Puia sp.]|jgi:protoporphyrinogen oxidase
MTKTAIIVGAGPAGLTAAYELLKRTGIRPIILEKSGDIGGISKTVNYKGNRIDIGGHRFFSKSDRVMDWWLRVMPLEDTKEMGGATIQYHNQTRTIPREAPPLPDSAANPHSSPGQPTLHHPSPSTDPDNVMLIRRRLSRIYFLRKFFSYPIRLSVDTLRKLGVVRTMGIVFSYLRARLFPRREERSLEDFLINRFGSRLYRIFFKDYTEKVWGVACSDIPAEWGAQRIKGVSVSAAIAHAIRSALGRKEKGIAQKKTETSQIERFMYPKFGPGQLWEEVARQVRAMGGEIRLHQDVRRVHTKEDRVSAIESTHHITGETSLLEGDYFFSTMPVSELIAGMDDNTPREVKEVAAGLQYRDFITVGILLKRKISLEDTWIYIQEKDVKVGRLQLFNNWSPYLVKDPANTWLGMEYFCNTQDEFWALSDEEIRETAIGELEKIGLGRKDDVLDSVVLRMEKTYPAYFGDAYANFDKVRSYTDRLDNLFLIGRNGMHKYNNSDHSMLTAMVAVDNICDGITGKSNIWSINTEQEYHEENTK